MDATDALNEETGESWIFVAENQAVNYGNHEICHENKEQQSDDNETDTDSISIIDECESDAACDFSAENTDPFKDNNIISDYNHDINTTTLQPGCNKQPSQDEPNENAEVEPLLSSSSIKTYVHKKNDSVNTMLNVILLGSVLTATGLAIGHMWGVQDDCILHTNTTVTEVLSNLRKLQVENQYLKSKLKEMEKIRIRTMTPNGPEKKIQNDVDNNLADLRVLRKIRKQRDVDDPTVMSQVKNPHFHQEFDNQINLLNTIYEDNKHWLDKEIVNRIRREDLLKQTHSTITDDGRIVPLERKSNTVKIKPNIPVDGSSNILAVRTKIKKPKNNLDANGNILASSVFAGPMTLEEYNRRFNLHRKDETNVSKPTVSEIPDLSSSNDKESFLINDKTKGKPEKKLYSDALKNLQEKRRAETLLKANSEKVNGDTVKDLEMDNSNNINKPAPEVSEAVGPKLVNKIIKDSFNSRPKKDNSGSKEVKNKKFKNYYSDDDTVVKDHRYVGQKHKNDKKKDDRQKSFKKPKHDHKYEQWEMKRGYLKDDDSHTIVSVDDLPKYPDRNHLSQEWEIINYMNQYTDEMIRQTDSLPLMIDESEFNSYNTQPPKRSREYFTRVQPSGGDWYSKMASGRKEIRDKKHLSGMSAKNKAQWYFERMNDREQCRKQVKNVTKNFHNVHSTKRSMNYKAKR